MNYPTSHLHKTARRSSGQLNPALWLIISCTCLCAWMVSSVFAQSSATGALGGTVTDQTGAAIVGAEVRVTNQATQEVRAVPSQSNGAYSVPLLNPGSYTVEVSKTGFKLSRHPDIRVDVTETHLLNVQMQVGTISEKVEVNTAPDQLQTESSTLGRVTVGEVVSTLPLVTRNYTQIIALNPGIATEVTNATDLGRGNGGANLGDVSGGSGARPGPFVANGSGGAADNNFQMDGAEINDLQSSGNLSGGVAIPNPDTIQEFKVQTGQYDASYGRNAGSSVNLITKSGTNNFHGNVWEYFRNEILNANLYAFNLNKVARPVLRQNQFGFDFGGPIWKNKLFFFTSYQGTRQLNGVSNQCTANLSLPPLTNDRSRTGLGAVFGGQTEAFFGGTVASDGSNITAPSLALLSLKLPNGQFAIPTPQAINPNAPFGQQGTVSLTEPCPFDEDQGMVNIDFAPSEKSKFAGKFFLADSDQTSTVPGTNVGEPATAGFPVRQPESYRVFSLSHSYVFNPSLLNQATLGYHRTTDRLRQFRFFNFSDLGITVPSFENKFGNVGVAGAIGLGGNGQDADIVQNTVNFTDSVTYIHGRHSFRFGGGLAREQINFDLFSPLDIDFLDFPGLLLGDPFLTVELGGDLARDQRAWDTNAYAQDDVKLTSRLTLNLGLRYERLGALADTRGRNASIDPTLLNPNPSAGGTIQGYVVSRDFPGTIPQGVSKLDNNFGIRGLGQNTWDPRIGFAYQLPYTDRFVLRGGYGIFHSRLTGQTLIPLITVPPFDFLRVNVFPGTKLATPVDLTVPSVPFFTPYSPTTSLSPQSLAPNLRPPVVQQYSLNLQSKLSQDMVLEIGYIGSRGTRLIQSRSINQALSASSSDPIRGQTDNTLANLPLRVPYEGFSPGNFASVESEGASWYNSATASLDKRFRHGLQFLAAYTFARSLTESTSSFIGANGAGVVVGNQNDPAARYGPDGFIRPHRLVISYVYDLPFLQQQSTLLAHVLGGWRISGVTVFQSGHLLPVTGTNGNNLFGVTSDFAELAPSCTLSQINRGGSVESKLTDYFNTSCFGSYPVISADGGTAFGNTKPGIVHGPAQMNWDIGIAKQFKMKWPTDAASFELRGDFFNAFNTPQFVDPDTNVGDSSFGAIPGAATSVNPRVIQLALRVNF